MGQRAAVRRFRRGLPQSTALLDLRGRSPASRPPSSVRCGAVPTGGTRTSGIVLALRAQRAPGTPGRPPWISGGDPASTSSGCVPRGCRSSTSRRTTAGTSCIGVARRSKLAGRYTPLRSYGTAPNAVPHFMGVADRARLGRHRGAAHSPALTPPPNRNSWRRWLGRSSASAIRLIGRLTSSPDRGEPGRARRRRAATRCADRPRRSSSSGACCPTWRRSPGCAWRDRRATSGDGVAYHHACDAVFHESEWFRETNRTVRDALVDCRCRRPGRPRVLARGGGDAPRRTARRRRVRGHPSRVVLGTVSTDAASARAAGTGRSRAPRGWSAWR